MGFMQSLRSYPSDILMPLARVYAGAPPSCSLDVQSHSRENGSLIIDIRASEANTSEYQLEGDRNSERVIIHNVDHSKFPARIDQMSVSSVYRRYVPKEITGILPSLAHSPILVALSPLLIGARVFYKVKERSSGMYRYGHEFYKMCAPQLPEADAAVLESAIKNDWIHANRMMHKIDFVAAKALLGTLKCVKYRAYDQEDRFGYNGYSKIEWVDDAGFMFATIATLAVMNYDEEHLPMFVQSSVFTGKEFQELARTFKSEEIILDEPYSLELT